MLKKHLIEGLKIFRCLRSMSIAQVKGLSEGLQGDDCTFMIITKDWRGETTYNENDQVEVDIQSLRTGEVMKPRIADSKDGCYEVKYKLDDAGGFSVSVMIEGEKVWGSPFKLKVEKRAKGKYEKKSGQRFLLLCLIMTIYSRLKRRLL